MLAVGDHWCRDWSALPGELLASIRAPLPAADFCRFAAVCTAWRRRPAPSTPAPLLPWLMVPPSPSFSSSSTGEAATCRFFSPSDGRTYLVPVPELRGTRCVGSCEGWVASFDDATAEMSLVNPLTRAPIPLPSPLAIMPHLTAARDGEGRIVMYVFVADGWDASASHSIDDVHGLTTKVVMPSAATDAVCKVAATFDCLPILAFAAVGGEKWAAARGAAGDDLVDIVYYDGDGKFYGLNFDNRVFRWHADHAEIPEFYCRPTSDFPWPSDRNERYLAVHRPWGDMLLVFVDSLMMLLFRDALERRAQKVEAVKVFRCRGDGPAHAWLPLESLSGCSLFLGKNQSICLSAQDVPEVRADCIFFIDPGLSSAYRRGADWTRLWVKEGVLEPYCPSEWEKSYEVPLWFTPNLS